MSETLAVLKLVSKFANLKDMRGFAHYVQVVKDFDKDTVKFLASNGHIAIKVTRKGTHFAEHIDLPQQISIKSIERACKVNELSLLDKGEDEIRFPDFERAFKREDQYEVCSAMFDSKYLALIFQAIETFRKSIKCALAQVVIEPLANDKPNFMSFVINVNTMSEIRVDIAIMGLKK